MATLILVWNTSIVLLGGVLSNVTTNMEDRSLIYYKDHGKLMGGKWKHIIMFYLLRK